MLIRDMNWRPESSSLRRVPVLWFSGRVGGVHPDGNRENAPQIE